MNAAIAYVLVVGVLVAAGARVGEEALRLAQRPVRWAWAGALVLLFALAIRATVTGTAPAGVPVNVPAPVLVGATAVQTEAAGLDVVLAVIQRTQDLVGGIPGDVATRLGQLVPAPLANVLAAVWATMSVAVLVLLVLVYWRFSRAVRTLPVSTMHGARVRVSRSAGPAVVGIRDPQVVVPAWLLDAPEAEQRLAISHEREHLAARDPQLLIAACVAVAALPWHPAAWWMLARLRLAVEMDCDRRVLAAGTPRRLYGSTLIDIAARGGRLPFGAPALADHTTHLERRLIAMTPTTTPYRRTRLLAVGAAALLIVAAACEARLPSAPEIEGMDAAAVAENPLTKAALAGDTTIAWYVDDARVTAEESRAIAAEKIATIEVNKGVRGNEIRIRTKAAAAAAGPDAGAAISPLPEGPGAPVAGARTEIRDMRPLSADFAGIILIDGTAADGKALARLGPDRIASVEIIKGSAARKLYDDPRAEKGVIRVTTKP